MSLLPRIVTIKKGAQEGQKRYQDRHGAFISKSKYDTLMRQSLVSGKFVTAGEASTLIAKEKRMRHRFGKPPTKWTWVRIADKYPERFAAYQ